MPPPDKFDWFVIVAILLVALVIVLVALMLLLAPTAI